MWGHLNERQIVDALGGAASARAETHLGRCAACASRLEELREGLLSAREAEVPEPSPVFWETFRRQVDKRIDASPREWSFGWRPALATGLAVAALISLVPAGPEREAGPSPEALPAWSALPPVGEDAGLRVLQGLGPSEVEVLSTSSQAGVVGLAFSLSDAERQAVALALQAELPRNPS